MTDELAAIEARHSTNMDDPEDDRWCQSEGEEWPCDTSKVLAALHVEQEARARVEDDYDHLVEVAREAAALLKRARLEQSIRHVHVAEAALRALIDPATPEPVEGEPTDMEPCDICDIRAGHDVHCIRYPHSRPRVTVIWKTAADRLVPASEGEPTDA